MTRLRIGYLVPGHHLVPTAGPTRNVLCLAGELARSADVTIVFRRLPQGIEPLPFRLEAFEPDRPPPDLVDDAAVRGTGLADLWRYLGTLRRYAATPRFDVVLEKSWLLSGYLARAFRAAGVPGAVVENHVRRLRAGGPRDLLSQVGSRAALRRLLPRADAVIAETEALRRALVERVRVAPERVTVVGLGVDHQRFRPADRALARARLGLSPSATILLYFGVLDARHDLEPCLRAVAAGAHGGTGGIEVHVLGDGQRRAAFEALSAGAPVRFHGRVSQAEVPGYVAAADLCLAPYDRAAFHGGELEYFTLKIPEAMACARAVATVPCEQTRALIEDGVSGFLLDNTPQAWAELLASLPARERLDEMGLAAAERAAPITWERTARGYLEVCERIYG